MTKEPDRFIWYELMTTDAKAAEDFYRSVIGWGAQDFGGDMPYTVVTADGVGVGGIMALPEEACAEGAQPGWIGYIGVADVDAAAERITAAGGTVHRLPADIPDVGRFAVVADPQGASFMLLTPSSGEERPAVGARMPGHVGWHELYTTDWQAALAFYSDQFGWTRADAVDMGPMGTYQLFATGGEPTGGMMNYASLPRPAWGFYFIVEEIDSAIGRISGKGGRIVNGPHEVPGGAWIVQAQDPQGAIFALTAPRR